MADQDQIDYTAKGISPASPNPSTIADAAQSAPSSPSQTVRHASNAPDQCIAVTPKLPALVNGGQDIGATRQEFRCLAPAQKSDHWSGH
jgi:hypothetical protein